MSEPSTGGATVASATSADEPPGARRPLPLAVRIIAMVIAFGLGGLVGVLGAFVHAMEPRVLGIPLPAGLALALATEVGLLVSTGFLLRSRPAILAPAAGWLLPVFAFSVPRPEGDLIITSAVVGYTFLLGGALLIGLALAVPYESSPPRTTVARSPVAPRRELP